MESALWQYHDIHEHSGAKQSGVKVDNGLILMQDLASTWIGPEQWDITHHHCACFLEDLSEYHYPPPRLCLVCVCGGGTDQKFRLVPKLGPKHSKTYLWLFWF